MNKKSKKIKILFVIDSLHFGGAERQLVELIKGLEKKDKYDIHLIYLINSKQGYIKTIEPLHVNIRYFPRLFKYDIYYPLVCIINYIIKNKIDIVHTFMNMGSLFGCLAAKITKRPVVCSAIRDAKDKTKKEKYLKLFLSYISDIFVSNSKSGLLNRFKMIKPHFKVVYNGIDLSRFETKDKVKLDNLKKELGISNFFPVIGMVASLSYYKDQESLLKSAPLILKSFPNACFLFVGDGPKRKNLEIFSEKLGIRDKVIFAGYRDDVDHIYHLIDVCVLLTNAQIHLEGISNTLIEAMASGVPVVASHGGGTSELVKHFETGMLVPPDDIEKISEAIIMLLKDKVLYHKIAKRSKNFVQKMFNLERYVNKYENIYFKLLKKASKK